MTDAQSEKESEESLSGAESRRFVENERSEIGRSKLVRPSTFLNTLYFQLDPEKR